MNMTSPSLQSNPIMSPHAKVSSPHGKTPNNGVHLFSVSSQVEHFLNARAKLPSGSIDDAISSFLVAIACNYTNHNTVKNLQLYETHRKIHICFNP